MAGWRPAAPIVPDVAACDLSFETVRATCASEGIGALASIPVPERLDSHGLDRLLADGIGDMAYLAEHRSLRLEPRRMLPGAHSLLVVLLAYQAPAMVAAAGGLKRARYTAGADYHRVLRRKLARVGRQLCEASDGAQQRATVDSAPVNERSLALLAGLGWIGRNGLLLHPQRGSYHFIGCLFTTLRLETRRAPHGSDRCGSCRACETRCPTAALQDRRVLSTRCIRYLPIEHHGVIPRALAERFEGWWFGCDLCQEVCPWNRFAPPAEDARLDGVGEDEHDLLAIGPGDFDRHFAGRAVRRIGYQRFRRNLLVALWSLGRSDACAAIIAEGLELVRAQADELGFDCAARGPIAPLLGVAAPCRNGRHGPRAFLRRPSATMPLPCT